MPAAEPTPQNDTSSQVCHIKLSGIRKHTSIRCDTTIWQAFKQFCSANGLSTCHVLELVLLGATVGLQTRVAQPTTINVFVDAPRVVKRVRRRQLIFENEIEALETNDVNESSCDLCGKPVVAVFRHGKSGIVKRVCVYHATYMKEDSRWNEVTPNG
jgi:hypothetical protein